MVRYKAGKNRKIVNQVVRVVLIEAKAFGIEIKGDSLVDEEAVRQIAADAADFIADRLARKYIGVHHS